jgi:hypothetical protein
MPLLALVGLLVSWQTAGQIPPIGIIDFYGLRTLSENQVRQALQFKEGDVLQGSDEEIQRRIEEAEKRLQALPGVNRAKLNLGCCDAGRATLYVGIEENGAVGLQFHEAPQGAVRLPKDVVQAGDEFEKALTLAVEKGDAAEDDSRGYTLFHNPACRAIQDRFLNFAARDLQTLEDVLQNSADAGHRALAAEIIGYAEDKRAVIPYLVGGMSDPDENVRNNSMRALWVMAEFAQRQPEKHIQIPSHPFVAMLNSLNWTDRNKSSLALYELTAKRDPAILTDLREHSLAALIEMARWKSPGHAQPSFFLVGRIAGLKEEQIQKAWDENDRERVISAALKETRSK